MRHAIDDSDIAQGGSHADKDEQGDADGTDVAYHYRPVTNFMDQHTLRRL